MDTHLSGLCFECKALYTYIISQIKQFFYQRIEYRSTFFRQEIVAAQIQLNPAARILQVHEHGFAGFPTGHYPAGQ